MKDNKKISVIMAAVNAYLNEEAVGVDIIVPGKSRELSPTGFWKASGRQEIMQMRTLWQRRIVGR